MVKVFAYSLANGDEFDTYCRANQLVKSHVVDKLIREYLDKVGSTSGTVNKTENA